MTKLITMEDVQFASCPSSASDCLKRAEELCKELESGNIVFFPSCPFEFSQENIEFLLKQKQGKRKNIAYKPHLNKLTNAQIPSREDFENLHRIMRDFSQKTTTFLSKLLTPYASRWYLDYASFRPFQEKGRKSRMRARNDLLHTDAFPTRPMHGNRILRFFMNINPEENRKWITADHFETLVEKFAGTEKLPLPKAFNYTLKEKLVRLFKRVGVSSGLPIKIRSPYDEFMLSLHHFLKENQEYQEKAEKNYWDFPPGSCWLVFTDFLTHAALQGQYALEQTFLIPKDAQLNPEKAPISILEKFTGHRMTDPFFSK